METHLAGNDFFVAILSSLNTAITSGIRVNLKITQAGSRERLRKVLEEHQAIFDAIASGDATSADLAMRYHINRARLRVTNRLRDQ